MDANKNKNSEEVQFKNTYKERWSLIARAPHRNPDLKNWLSVYESSPQIEFEKNMNIGSSGEAHRVPFLSSSSQPKQTFNILTTFFHWFSPQEFGTWEGWETLEMILEENAELSRSTSSWECFLLGGRRCEKRVEGSPRNEIAYKFEIRLLVQLESGPIKDRQRQIDFWRSHRAVLTNKNNNHLSHG